MTTPDEPSSLEPIIQDMLAQYAKAEQDRLDAMKHMLKADILPQFRRLGIDNVQIAYSGYGDDGSIDGIQYRDPTGNRVDRQTIPTQLIEDLESCVYELLPAGFEIGEGAQGTLTIDIPKGTVTIAHQENVTNSRDSTREFTL